MNRFYSDVFLKIFFFYKIHAIVFLGSNNNPKVSYSISKDQKFNLIGTLRKLFFSILDNFPSKWNKYLKVE